MSGHFINSGLGTVILYSASCNCLRSSRCNGQAWKAGYCISIRTALSKVAGEDGCVVCVCVRARACVCVCVTKACFERLLGSWVRKKCGLYV